MLLKVLLHANTRRIILILSHTLIFLIGLYIASGSSHENENNQVTVNKISLVDVGMKYHVDKVTIHHYERIYEKYLRKYIGTDVSILEIGLGCRMYYGAGASAHLWRNYLGPQADIHFIEYDKECGEAWYQTHGVRVKDVDHLFFFAFINFS